MDRCARSQIMVGSSTPTPASRAPERLIVAEVRLQEYRNFDDCSVALAPQTLLVGENYSGKSSFLRGLEISLGGAQVRDDDFRIANGVQAKEFIIDVRVEPASGASFESSIVQVLGPAIQVSKSGMPSFYAIRARGILDPREGPTLRRCFLRGWASD